MTKGTKVHIIHVTISHFKIKFMQRKIQSGRQFTKIQMWMCIGDGITDFFPLFSIYLCFPNLMNMQKIFNEHIL